MTRTFALLYYLRKENINEKGEVPICLRITVDGKRAVMSTQQKIKPDRWNNKANRVSGTNEDSRSINAFLNNLETKVEKCYRELDEKGSIITADSIRNTILGTNSNNKHTLIEAFEKHNKQMEERIGIDYSHWTHKRYITTLRHIKQFLKSNYQKNDYYLMELPYEFITDFEHFLKITRGCNHNPAQKYIRNFRKIINIAVNNAWLPRDPFSKYKSKLEDIVTVTLNEEELHMIEEKIIKTPRLESIRDVFVFCCYTGLPYVDAEKLTLLSIKEKNGKKSIEGYRTKTKRKFYVPLLPKALEILKKYEFNPQNRIKGRLLPVISNQKFNAYLKELAEICGINKNLTFHVARRTFSNLCRENGIPIELVSHMLGHSSIRTTLKHYTHITEESIDEKMQQLADMLKPKSLTFNLN